MKLRETLSGFVINKDNSISDFETNKDKLLESVFEEIGDRIIIIWCQFQHEIYKLAEKYNGVALTSKTKNRDNIIRQFKDGKIIKATANDTEKINKVFDTDEGARYIGEFAIGVNPYILNPMKDTLFDEKIMGSFHFTPGNCYEVAPNGNESSIHWDLVCIQTKEWGGGEIYFDDVLIRKDGRFVGQELECLNPEHLI